MPTTIKDIPNEVLKDILVKVREQGGYDALRMAILVSHLWNDAGSPVLYEHVVLDNVNIKTFLDSSFDKYINIWALTDHLHNLTCFGHEICERAASSTFAEAKEMYAKPLLSEEQLRAKHKRRIRNRKRTWDHVHSLTLSITPEGTGNLRGEERTRRNGGRLTPVDVQLMRLAGILPHQFPLLESFSLFTEEKHFEDLTEMQRKGPGFLDTRVVLELVKSLPESCVNLLLDTNARDIHFGATSPRMCLLLREMMPRLRHLSLRVSYVCESMIVKSQERDEETQYVHAPHLRSLSISFVTREIPHWFDLMYTRKVCRRLHLDATAQLPNDDSLSSTGQSGIIRFAGALQQAYSQGCYPQAESIQIVSPHKIYRRGKAWSERISDQMILIRDCINDKTHALRFIPSNEYYKYDQNRAIIDRSGGFAMGDQQLLKLFVEADGWYKTDKYSAILPIETPEVRFEKSSLKTLSPQELEYLTESLARERHEMLQSLHEDLTEGERHPGRVFEFEGAGFVFKDFIPENF